MTDLGSISVPAQVARDFGDLLVAVEALIEGNCTLADVILKVNVCRKHLDLIGADIDPGFGVDVEDSARLLELRSAIDTYLGWRSPESEERGDYVARVREVAEAIWDAKAALRNNAGADLVLALVKASSTSPEDVLSPESSRSPSDEPAATQHPAPMLASRVAALEEKIRRQRKELRRFNRDQRIRSEAAQHQPGSLRSSAAMKQLSSMTEEQLEEVLSLTKVP
jgi:hypothetical protein